MTLIIVLVMLIGFYFIKKSKFKSTSFHQTKQKTKQKSKQHSKSEFFESCISDMKKDFTQDPYVDKLEASNNVYKYIFMNGDFLILDLSVAAIPLLKRKTGTKQKIINVNINQARIFADLFFQIVNSATTRIHGSRYSNKYKTSDELKTGKLFTDSQLREQKTYNKLVKIYNLRKVQLDTMSSADSNRKSLENELNVVEKKLKKIKPKTGL